MLEFAKVTAQIEAMADWIALEQAELGQVAASWWTPETVRQHNRRWLAARAPGLAARVPKADEPAVCAAEGCGGLCILVGWEPASERLIQACQKCGEAWGVPLAAYAGL